MKKSMLGLAIIGIVVVSFVGLYVIKPQYFGVGEKLVIFHAGSLEYPMSLLEKIFEEKYGGVDVVRLAGGSVMISRKIVELDKKTDVLAVADYKVIEEILFPGNYSDWYIIFASNEMVLAYTDQSRYADEVNASNWYEILLRSDVYWGHSDPELDPCGYRTLLVLQLAEKFYNVSNLYEEILNNSNGVVRPKSVDLLALLESGQIDYAFEYKSVAVQHGLNFVDLPDEIDLGHYQYSDFYSQANYTLSNGVTIIGEPILYGLTIPNNAENKKGAIKFIQLLFSEEGQEVFNESGQPFIYPGLTNNISRVPQELRDVVSSWEGDVYKVFVEKNVEFIVIRNFL